MSRFIDSTIAKVFVLGFIANGAHAQDVIRPTCRPENHADRQDFGAATR